MASQWLDGRSDRDGCRFERGRSGRRDRRRGRLWGLHRVAPAHRHAARAAGAARAGVRGERAHRRPAAVGRAARHTGRLLRARRDALHVDPAARPVADREPAQAADTAVRRRAAGEPQLHARAAVPQLRPGKPRERPLRPRLVGARCSDRPAGLDGARRAHPRCDEDAGPGPARVPQHVRGRRPSSLRLGLLEPARARNEPRGVRARAGDRRLRHADAQLERLRHDQPELRPHARREVQRPGGRLPGGAVDARKPVSGGGRQARTRAPPRGIRYRARRRGAVASPPRRRSAHRHGEVAGARDAAALARAHRAERSGARSGPPRRPGDDRVRHADPPVQDLCRVRLPVVGEPRREGGPHGHRPADPPVLLLGHGPGGRSRSGQPQGHPARELRRRAEHGVLGRADRSRPPRAVRAATEGRDHRATPRLG